MLAYSKFQTKKTSSLDTQRRKKRVGSWLNANECGRGEINRFFILVYVHSSTKMEQLHK